MKKLLSVLSYILTAAIACLTTVILLRVVPDKDYNKLMELEQLISERFVGEEDRTKMEDAAAWAMIQALGDRWSYYVAAAEYENFSDNRNNEYVGIGITTEAYQNGNGLRVAEVASGGPAEEAGILPGDIFIEADGEFLLNKTENEAKKIIQGQENSVVVITLQRGEEELTVEVTRRRMPVAVATGRMLENNIGLVTIKNFNTNCFIESKQAVDGLLEKGAEKLIFDVRYNGGGYAEEMVDLLDYLLPEGRLFKTVDADGKEEINMSDADCIEVPMAVLVNGGSYSAAECFAAVLEEYDAAVIVGEKTSGKGYYQLVFRLKDGSAVGLSTGKYYTSNNVNLEGIGLTPDFEVPVDEKTAVAIYAGTLLPEEDPQIVKAMEVLGKE